jgi:pimeloyl-ACP methyl ester carboxylesterase
MDVSALKGLGVGFSASEEAGEALPTMIMVHGAGGRSEVWSSQVSGLSGIVRAVALDLPGHGESKGPVMESIEAYSDWLAGVIEKTAERPVFLMGHSMGGAIAQITAIRRPELLSGIILAATGPRLKVAPQFLQGLRDDFDATVDRFLGYAYGPGAGDALIREGIRIMKEAGQECVYKDLFACNSFDSTKGLSTIKMPCLVACGENDLLTPPALSAKLHEAITGSTLKILPGAGHTLMIENPRAFNQIAGTLFTFAVS